MTAPAAPRATPVAGRGALAVLWRFSRPHTIVGTTLSVLALYVVAAAELPGMALGDGLGDLALTLLAGAAVNVYIVGLNQITDVEIDRINKPHLPIAAGDLSPAGARRIVGACAALALVLALTQGWVETLAVTAAMAVGTAYSAPPLRLKRRPAVAATSIAGVRSLAVNLGVYLHFADSLGGRPETSAIPPAVIALTLFMMPFALAIALLKDVPDVAGDRHHAIATFSVRLGPARAFAIGTGLLAGAYVAMIAAGPVVLAGEVDQLTWVAGHAAALAALLAWAAQADPADPAAFTRFYLRVWTLFFAEYALVPLSVVLA